MMTAAGAEGRFRHEALLYAGEADFVRRTAAFVRAGLEAQEPVLVLVGARKLDLLRSELDGDAAGVAFADIGDVGANPARIIPAWRDFVEAQPPGRRFRGVGEPIDASRSPAEVVECQRHESLLNLAFGGGREWWLVCPYDTETLGPGVIAEARAAHPFVFENGSRGTSASYAGAERAAAALTDPLPDPPPDALEVRFGAGPLAALRKLVGGFATASGLGASRTADLVLAAHETATNSIRHGGGGGVLRIWEEPDAVVCEIRDRGRLVDPLAGRERPGASRESGRGLWLVNQLCDLVQIRAVADGTVFRLHMRRHP